MIENKKIKITLSKLTVFLVPIKVTLLSIADKAQIDLGSVLILS